MARVPAWQDVCRHANGRFATRIICTPSGKKHEFAKVPKLPDTTAKCTTKRQVASLTTALAILLVGSLLVATYHKPKR